MYSHFEAVPRDIDSLCENHRLRQTRSPRRGESTETVRTLRTERDELYRKRKRADPGRRRAMRCCMAQVSQAAPCPRDRRGASIQSLRQETDAGTRSPVSRRTLQIARFERKTARALRARQGGPTWRQRAPD